jgi:hypothetical protein
MVDLGIPSAPPPTLAPRRKSRQLKVGSVLVGGMRLFQCNRCVQHLHQM